MAVSSGCTPDDLLECLIISIRNNEESDTYTSSLIDQRLSGDLAERPPERRSGELILDAARVDLRTKDENGIVRERESLSRGLQICASEGGNRAMWWRKLYGTGLAANCLLRHCAGNLSLVPRPHPSSWVV